MTSRIVLVTGANRGIGLAIVQALSQKNDAATYLLGVRNLTAGQEAISQLHSLGITATLDAVELDITEDGSISSAAKRVQEKYGRLDVLINNAGIALIPSSDGSDLRNVYNTVFNTNITSIAAVTYFFLPLLKRSTDPRVINISSARGSMNRSSSPGSPPTVSIPYSVSKTALNALTIDMAKQHKEVLFQCASPGHCSTALNGFKGKKEPLEGARVVVELVNCEREAYSTGFWEWEGDGMGEVPW